MKEKIFFGANGVIAAACIGIFALNGILICRDYIRYHYRVR